MHKNMKRNIILGGAALSALITVGGCAPDPNVPYAAPWPSSPDAPYYDHGALAIPAATVADAINALDGQLYAHYDSVAYISSVPPVGAAMRTFTTSYGFTRFDKDTVVGSPTEGELIQTDSFCFSTFVANQPFLSVYSDLLTSQIVPRTAAVTVTVGGGTTHIVRPETPTYIGMVNDPNVPLITDQSFTYPVCNSTVEASVTNAPCMFDHDQDGNPGVTVGIVGAVSGDIYMARRERFAPEMDVYASGVLAGHVVDSSEQLVHSASNPLLAAPSDPPQEGDLDLSPIVLLPLGPTAVTYGDCTGLKNYHENVNTGFFPQPPHLAVWDQYTGAVITP